VTDAESCVLAGFVAGFCWTPGREGWTADLPSAVPTVSDCLADFLPADLANDNRGNHTGTPLDVTWFPALITEHDVDEAIRSAGLRPADETRGQVG
jgi:hypothetical protein